MMKIDNLHVLNLTEYKALMNLGSDPSSDDIGAAFIKDIDDILQGYVDRCETMNQMTIYRISSEMLNLYATYSDYTGTRPPIKVDGYDVVSYNDIMFIPERNHINIVHRNAYIRISEWSLGEKDANGSYTRGPHFKGNMDLGYCQDIYPEYYDQLCKLKVDEFVKLGNSRFQRIR